MLEPLANRGSVKPEPRLTFVLMACALAYYAFCLGKLPFNVYDEGYLYYIADLFGQGLKPYREVRLFSYLPGLFYLYTPFVGGTFSGYEVVLARALMTLGLILKVGLFFRCCRRFTGPRVAIVATLAVLLIPGAWYKFHIGLLSLLSLSTLLDYLDKPNPRNARWVGMALGLAVLLRIDIAISTVLLFALILIWLRWAMPIRKRVWPDVRAAGFVALVFQLPLQISLILQGLFLDHLRQWLAFVDLVSRRTQADLRLDPPHIHQLGQLDQQGITAWMYYLATLLALVFLIFIVTQALMVRRERGSINPELGLVAFWMLSGLPQMLLERPDVPHLTEGAAYLALPAAILAERALRQRRQRILVATGFLFFAAFFVGKHIAFGEGWSVGVARQPTSWFTLSNGFRYPSQDFQPWRWVFEKILQNSGPEDRVEVLPYAPGVAFATGRRMATRETYLIPHSMGVPGLEDEYLQTLHDHPPRLVLYWPELSFTGRPDGRLPAYAPRVDRYLEEHFRLLQIFGQRRLLEPIPTDETRE